MQKIWEQRPDEKVEDYDFFKIYLDLEPKRSLKKIAEITGKGKDKFKKLSAKFDWQSRVKAYDADKAQGVLNMEELKKVGENPAEEPKVENNPAPLAQDTPADDAPADEVEEPDATNGDISENDNPPAPVVPIVSIPQTDITFADIFNLQFNDLTTETIFDNGNSDSEKGDIHFKAGTFFHIRAGIQFIEVRRRLNETGYGKFSSWIKKHNANYRNIYNDIKVAEFVLQFSEDEFFFFLNNFGISAILEFSKHSKDEVLKFLEEYPDADKLSVRKLHEELQLQLAEKNIELEDQRCRADEAEQQQTTLQLDNENLQEDNNRLNGQVGNLQQRNLQLVDENTNIKKELLETQKQLQTLQETRNADIQKAKADVQAQFQQKLSNVEKQSTIDVVEKVPADYDKTKEDLATAKTTIEEKDKEIEDLKAQITAAAPKTFEDLPDEMNFAIVELDAVKSLLIPFKLNADIDTLKKQLELFKRTKIQIDGGLKSTVADLYAYISLLKNFCDEDEN